MFIFRHNSEDAWNKSSPINSLLALNVFSQNIFGAMQRPKSNISRYKQYFTLLVLSKDEHLRAII